MAKNDKSVKRGVYLYIDGKQIKNDVNSIKAEIKKLTGELKDMTIGSREYVEQMAKIRNLNSMLKEHQKSLRGVNKEVKATTFSFGKFVDGFNRFGGFIASVVASLTGLVLGLKALRDEKNKLEDSQASLKSLTGLDETSVDWLTKQAQKLSTTMTKEGLRVRQSTAEILDAYMLVGSAKAELLGSPEALAAVTEEAMRLQAAAGDITLAEAVDAVTLSLNQFGAPAEDAARYVNVLAAGSKEGASGVASITSSIKRAGVAAAGANVSIEETVALVETLAYKGITDEVAGTALKKFFLVLQTGADDTNPKVVGLAKALENLKAKNMGAADIKKMFGEEGYNAAAVILQNTEMVNQLTEAVTGTNIAFEQSAINSDTASAKLAQVRNQMKLAGIELIEKLNPAILVSTNAMTYVIKILPGVIDWFKKWGAEVTILSAYFLLLATRVTITNKAIAAYHSVLAAGTAIKKGYALAIVAINAARDTSLRGLVNMRNAIRTSNALTRTATATVTLLKSALFLMTGQLKAARIAFQAFTIAARANPFILILTTLTAVVGAIVTFAKKTDVAVKAMKEFNEANSKAKGELTLLYNSLITTNAGTQKRLDLIKEFNNKYGGYLTNLLSEKATVDEITAAYNEAALAIQHKIAQQSLASQTENIQTQALTEQAEILEKVSDILSSKFADSDVARRMQNITSFVEKNIAAGKSVESIAKAIGDHYYDTGLFHFLDIGDMQEALEDYASHVQNTAQKVQNVRDKLSPWLAPDNRKKSSNELPEVVVTPNPSSNLGGASTTDNDIFLEENKRYFEELAALKTRYINSETMTREEYSRLAEELEIQHLQRKLEIAGVEPEKRAAIQQQILDSQIKLKETAAKQLETQTKEQSDKALSEHEKRFELEVEAATRRHYQTMTSEEEYQQEIARLTDKYYNAILNDTRVSEEEKAKIIQSVQQKSLDDEKAIYDKKTLQFNNMKNSIVGAAESMGEAMAKFFTDEETDFGDFMANVLTIMLDALEKQLIAQQAAAIAAVTINDISTKGLAGIATAAAKIALITAAFESAKAVLGNFYTGGYTGSGDWDEPKGIVHSNEFVANRYAVANPAVRPVLDLIDSAQRSGTIANLTGGDIAAVAGGSAHPVAAASSVMQLQAQSDDRELKQTVRGLSQVLSRLVERLDEPIEAYGVISGRHGWRQKLDEYDRLLNNKSRKP